MSRIIHHAAFIWTSRVLVFAYCLLVAFSWHEMWSDWDDTLLLVGSDALCGMMPLLCSATSYVVRLVVDVVIAVLAITGELAWRWRYRDHARAGAFMLLIASQVVVQIFMRISNGAGGMVIG